MWWLWMTLALASPADLRAAVAMGDCDAVRALVPEAKTDAQRLALGWCGVERGDKGAADVLAGIRVGPLADHARWQRARALVASGRHAEALSALERLELAGAPGLAVRALRGEALVRAGQSLMAREDLRALLDTEVGVQARYWLAVGGADRGEDAAAIATFARVWADDPHDVWAAPAAEALARLGAPVPDFETPEGRALIRDRIRTLTAAQRHADARALTERLGEAAPDAAITGLPLARARFRAKDYPAAVEAYAAALGDPPHATGGPDDLFDYALAMSRTGDYDTAAVIYGRLVAQHPTTPKGDLASYKLGYLEVDRGRCEVATTRLQAHVARMPTSKYLDEALWYLGRCAWKAGDLDAADRAWRALGAQRADSSLVPGAMYWRARIHARRGDAAAAQRGYEEVLRRFPVSGYAWFAAERLGRTFEARAAGDPIDLDRPAPERGLERAWALLAAGFPLWAKAELESIPATPVLDEGGTYALALLAATDARGARKLVRSCPSPWRHADPATRALCTPRPARGVVEHVAVRFALDPNLPYAIMTAESALQPEVTSIAGAAGLMQLMPAEAERVHAELLGDQPYHMLRLYDAPYNAALGTAELGIKQRDLGDLLNGSDLPAVIASYNGGEAAVRRWVAAWPAPPEPDEFTEDIGYTETRQYVKRVLGYLMAYRWAYGD